MKPISSANAENYKWGGPAGTDCDGWFLVRTPEINIIEERMPAGASETRHVHVHARQFFYVLEGELTMEVNGEDVVVRAREGVEVAPGSIHQATNRSLGTTRVLVTSQPPSHGDRLEQPV